MLHLLGFDHEINDEGAAEMQKEEELVLKSLGWKGKGLIKSAYDTVSDGSLQAESSNGKLFLIIIPLFQILVSSHVNYIILEAFIL